VLIVEHSYHTRSAVVELLIARGADVSLKTKSGKTAADLPSAKGNAEVSARLNQES